MSPQTDEPVGLQRHFFATLGLKQKDNNILDLSNPAFILTETYF